MNLNEERLISRVKPHILRCRAGDWNHAKRVVGWVKELGKKRKDLFLLVTAAYIHDIGWRDVLPKGKITFSKLLRYEEVANKNSKRYATILLREIGYSDNKITTINRLIKAADKHSSSRDDEAIIVDADNLSKLSINHLKDKYKREEWVKLYKLWKKELPKRIKTTKARTLYPSLLDRLIEDINTS